MMQTLEACNYFFDHPRQMMKYAKKKKRQDIIDFLNQKAGESDTIRDFVNEYLKENK